MSRRNTLAVLVGAAAGIVLRVWVYRSALGAPDSDEAIVGLMARHALNGELTTFYWGQPYGGSQEALLAVPGFALFGSSLLALRLVPIALMALTSIVVWRVGTLALGRRQGVAAGLLFWVWPAYPIVHGTVAFGFYGTDVLYTALLLLLALRVAAEPTPWRVATFAFVFGLAFWQTAQIIPVALPVIAWIVWRRPRVVRGLWYAIPVAALGALPWLIWNAENGWASVLARASADAYVRGLRLFASPLLPMLLGLRTPLTGELLLPKALMYAVYVGLLALFVWGAIRARRSDASLLYLVAAAFPIVWALSHRVSILTSHPVYLVVVSPVLALLLAQLATSDIRAVVVLAACLAVTSVSFARMDAWLTADRPHWPPATPRSLAPLIATLDRLGLRRVYAEYWIAYRLDFDTRERIVASPDQWLHWRFQGGQVTPVPSQAVRYRPYRRTVRRAPHGYVFFREPVEATPIRGALRRRGYERVDVGPFEVWALPRRH